ncbi:UxaA family hydrolase [Pseudomonas thivervalensis]|uniref:Galactonate dehydratase n=1 Tax=Pseudomonas thivervalensis TaxID=86265 RepID=A0A176NEN1_9PSED|nr:altronate dehydratase family protein [Pseudomonas thivervalensis]AXA54139.1 galactonate dehydratase [Pseudomonas thivervalensis]AXA59820.1 galactonate dehydratase [Pseudomonas thivervalensis]OAB49600.1 galactonate dehydratase [Pseudomonas thivervalensis]SDF67873.1 altronate hydrolase [Pseudomonas thivervalensis]
MNPPSSLLVLTPGDDVAVARGDIAEGQPVNADGLILIARQAVPSGHKLALRRVLAGQRVLKYGQTIGQATQVIEPGDHVHVHNLDMPATTAEHRVRNVYVPTSLSNAPATFEGYVREDGRVGTRNYIGVISSVNCSATVCKHIANAFSSERLKDFPNVDGVVAITHGSGCGMGAQGEGIDLLKRTLRGYADHANFAGVLLIGLGCEVNQLTPLMNELGERPATLKASLIIQDEGGTRDAVRRGIAHIEAMLPIINQCQRTTVAARHLCVGLQCGGSDGYSGITANPALGAAVDLLVQHGGTAILSETPEIYGAEHLLTARAASAEIADKLMARIHWWEAYVHHNDGDMNNNPSPGNKAGGITTILEKSLGAVAKAGATGLMGVYQYAETVDIRGLVFMDTPGYDPVSATGQVAGGANLICFTTGRGSTYGCKPTPSLKIATNTGLFQRMELDMDFNAGGIVDGLESVAQAGERLFRLMLETASGHRTCSEENGLGDNEFLPWQIGAVM